MTSTSGSCRACRSGLACCSSSGRAAAGVTMFGRKTRVLILDDRGPVLERLQSRFDVFWPPEIPVKTLAMYCAWGNEAIEAIKEIQPDILVLNHVFRKDEGAAREVTQWIDQKYPAPLIVAVHSD